MNENKQAFGDIVIPAGWVITMDARLADMKQGRDTAIASRQELIDEADGEERDLTEDELKSVATFTNQINALNRQITAREDASAIPTAGRRTDSTPVNRGTGGTAGRATVPAQAKQDDRKHGFRSFGEFAVNVHNAARGDDDATSRFKNVATTYSSEQNGPDGGYAVPPDFRTEIWEKVTGEDSLMGRASQLTTSANSITIPKDETTPWDTTTGIQAYWAGEGDVITQSKINLEMNSFRLNKLTALVPVSEELLEDAPGLESYLRAKTPAKMMAKINTAMIRGNGVGKPLGVLNAPSLLTISKELSQDAGTFIHQNVEEMYSRMWAPSRRRGVWIINQDLEPQLGLMAFINNKQAFPVPMYVPGGTIANQPYATLKGLPVIPVEAASTAGEFGDVMLVDWSQYMVVTKGEQIRTDVSMHLFFDQDLQAFRFIFRMTGAPMWGSAITPENGNQTRSWAVALETRA